MGSPLLDRELETICRIAKEAGLTTLSYFKKAHLRVDTKSDQSPVTQADRTANDHIVTELKGHFSHVPIISEESRQIPFEERKDWKEFFLVDPLDGTKEFIAGRDEYTVNIAWIKNGNPYLGVIYIPVQDTLYFAKTGVGSFKKEKDQEAKQIYSDLSTNRDGLRITHSRSHPDEKTEKYIKGLTNAVSVPVGSSIKFCFVAEGAADIYPRFGKAMEWDVAAGDCIYRNSARSGEHPSPLRYNTESLVVEGFILGLLAEDEA